MIKEGRSYLMLQEKGKLSTYFFMKDQTTQKAFKRSTTI